MVNNVVLIGRLTKDPVVRIVRNDLKIANFTLAVNRRIASKNDNAPTADFISCVVFGKLAELVESYVRKGSLIAVEGSIATSSYDDAAGNRIYRTDVNCNSVQFLEPRSARNEDTNVNQYTNTNTQNQSSGGFDIPTNDDFEEKVNDFDISSDDLPF